MNTSANISQRRPRWFHIPARILLVTFLLTLLSFAVSLLLGILGTVIAAGVRGVHPDLSHAYRQIAAPVAAAVGAIVLISMTVLEIRTYRREKVLQSIERSS